MRTQASTPLGGGAPGPPQAEGGWGSGGGLYLFALCFKSRLSGLSECRGELGGPARRLQGMQVGPEQQARAPPGAELNVSSF